MCHLYHVVYTSIGLETAEYASTHTIIKNRTSSLNTSIFLKNRRKNLSSAPFAWI